MHDETPAPIPEGMPSEPPPDRPIVMGMTITPDGKVSLLFNQPVTIASFDRNAALSIAKRLKELAMQAPVAVTPAGLIVPPVVQAPPGGANGNGGPPRHGGGA